MIGRDCGLEGDLPVEPVDFRHRELCAVERITHVAARPDLHEVGAVRRQIDTTVGDAVEERRAKNCVAAVAGRRDLGEEEYRGRNGRRDDSRVRDSLALGQEHLGVDEGRNDLLCAEWRRTCGRAGCGNRVARAPVDDRNVSAGVRDHEVRALDVVVATGGDATADDRRDERVGQVIERVLPRICPVLHRHRGAGSRRRRECHDAVGAVHGGRDDLGAIDLDRHLAGVGRGDAAASTIHDGALEHTEGTVAARLHVGREAERSVGVARPDDQRDCRRELEAVATLAVDEDRGAEVWNGRRVDLALESRRRGRRVRQESDGRSCPVHRDDERVADASRDVERLEAWRDERRVGYRDLAGHIVREGRVTAVEVVRATNRVTRLRRHLEGHKTPRTENLTHSHRHAVDSHDRAARVVRHPTDALAVDHREVPNAERGERARLDAQDEVLGVRRVDDPLLGHILRRDRRVDVRAGPANEFEVEGFQFLLPNADDDRDAKTRGHVRHVVLRECTSVHTRGHVADEGSEGHPCLLIGAREERCDSIPSLRNWVGLRYDSDVGSILGDFVSLGSALARP